MVLLIRTGAVYPGATGRQPMTLLITGLRGVIGRDSGVGDFGNCNVRARLCGDCSSAISVISSDFVFSAISGRYTMEQSG